MSIDPPHAVRPVHGVGVVVMRDVGIDRGLHGELARRPQEQGAIGLSLATCSLAVRFGVGLIGPAVATWMTWEDRRHPLDPIEATGILYIAMTLVLFGELTAMVLFHDSGVIGVLIEVRPRFGTRTEPNGTDVRVPGVPQDRPSSRRLKTSAGAACTSCLRRQAQELRTGPF